MGHIMKITNLKISTRLSLGFALLLTLMIVMTVVGILRLQQVGTSTQIMADTMLPKERLAQEWLSAVDVNGARTLDQRRRPGFFPEANGSDQRTRQ
jgi:methyl-accepting chemotaxis protein